jgi:hypothetical protein
MAIPSTIPQQLLPLNSLMLGLSIAVTLGANPNYSVVSTNGILSVTQKYCCNSNSRWQIKSIMKILRLLLWLLVLSMAIPSTIP